MNNILYLSTEGKEIFLKDRSRFNERYFKLARFTNRIYDHLIQHCEFIARYNKRGVLRDVLFGSRRPLTFDRDAGCISVEYNMKHLLTAEGYSDINTAMAQAAN